MEETGEQYIVVFALIVTEPAGDRVIVSVVLPSLLFR
jgi:hypothetical protein